jgi:hypothetical protein
MANLFVSLQLVIDVVNHFIALAVQSALLVNTMPNVKRNIAKMEFVVFQLVKVVV